MRFTDKPRTLIKVTKKFHKEALEIMGLSSFNIGKEACEERIYTLMRYLENVPGVPGTCEEMGFLGLRGIAYGHFLAGVLGWKVGYVIPRVKKKDLDFFAIASPREEYFVEANLAVMHSHYRKRNTIVELYEKIKSGQLPPSEPGKLFDLGEYFYGRVGAIMFYPFEEEDTAWLKEKTAKTLPLVGAVMDDSGNLINISVEEALGNLEKIIIEDREDFIREKKKQKLILAGYTAILGHLLKLGCGYNWGKAWFEDMYGVTVLYSSDKRYYLKPAKLIKSEFLSKEKEGRLLRLYHQIRNNELPPLETEGFPDEILL